MNLPRELRIRHDLISSNRFRLGNNRSGIFMGSPGYMGGGATAGVPRWPDCTYLNMLTEKGEKSSPKMHQAWKGWLLYRCWIQLLYRHILQLSPLYIPLTLAKLSMFCFMMSCPLLWKNHFGFSLPPALYPLSILKRRLWDLLQSGSL